MPETLPFHHTTEYQVSVPVFEGPLDLLLSLIEHAELDITTVSLALVTDQYLNYIHQMNSVGASEISAFLVIAAKLIQIKSEALLPRPLTHGAGEEDIGTSLIQQLQVYKQFKEIALLLQTREEKKLRSYLRLAMPTKPEGHLDLSDISLDDLWLVAQEILQKEHIKQELDSVIKPPLITIREKIALISKLLKKEHAISFNNVIKSASSKLEVVVTFLALLELIKQYRVTVQQDSLFREIMVSPVADAVELDDLEIEFGE